MSRKDAGNTLRSFSVDSSCRESLEELGRRQRIWGPSTAHWRSQRQCFAQDDNSAYPLLPNAIHRVQQILRSAIVVGAEFPHEDTAEAALLYVGDFLFRRSDAVIG